MCGMDNGGPTVDEPEYQNDEQYWDESTGQPLNADAVRAAREAEVEYMRRLGVYEEASMEDCIRDGCEPIPMRWIDVNKGDSNKPNIRSRAVLQETKRRSTLGQDGDISATFAATPPLEALRTILSLCMSQRGLPTKDRRVIGVYDVSRARFTHQQRERCT